MSNESTPPWKKKRPALFANPAFMWVLMILTAICASLASFTFYSVLQFGKDTITMQEYIKYTSERDKDRDLKLASIEAEIVNNRVRLVQFETQLTHLLSTKTK